MLPETQTGVWIMWYDYNDGPGSHWLLEPFEDTYHHTSFGYDGIKNEEITKEELQTCIGMNLQITPNYSVLPFGICGQCEGPVRYLDYLCEACREG